jgi:hypothetical protein
MSNAIQDAAASAASAASSAAEVASRMTYAGSATAVGFGFFSDNWIGLAGLGIGVATFFLNWFYKHREDRRREEEVKAAKK